MSENIGNLSKLMEGYNPQRQLLEQTRKLVKKWEPTGLLEDCGGEIKTHGMAVLLENQARQIIDEASRTGTSANSEEWSGVALPLVRRIFGELAAQEFVSVQPMNLPSGLIFYLDFKYGTAQTGAHTENADGLSCLNKRKVPRGVLEELNKFITQGVLSTKSSLPVGE